jgi:hypothetical protein
MAEEENDVEFFGDHDIKDRVEKLWGKVFESSNKVLHHNKVFGFTGIEVIPSPNIHQMMNTLRVIGFVIDILLAGAEKNNLDHDARRQLLNAKNQIANMEQVAAALKIGDRDDYEVAVEALDKQMVI